MKTEKGMQEKKVNVNLFNLPIEIESVKSKLQRGCVVLHANHFLVQFP